MNRRIVALAGAWGLAAFAAGCASTPSHFYTLSPTAVAAQPQAPAQIAIAVGPITIPAIVDVPEIVVRKDANQVWLDEFNRWASPLRANIGQVVAADLTALLGTASVSAILTVDADYRVAIDVQAFDSAPGDAATLTAVWVVHRIKDGKTVTGRTTSHEASVQSGYDALAAAHSRALGRLSQDIAEAIRGLLVAP
jgi:uncharacterized lipoprotein YmbA